MINYRVEMDLDVPDTGYWIARVYAYSDVLTMYGAFSESEAKALADAFIDGIKFARGES